MELKNYQANQIKEAQRVAKETDQAYLASLTTKDRKLELARRTAQKAADRQLQLVERQKELDAARDPVSVETIRIATSFQSRNDTLALGRTLGLHDVYVPEVAEIPVME